MLFTSLTLEAHAFKMKEAKAKHQQSTWIRWRCSFVPLVLLLLLINRSDSTHSFARLHWLSLGRHGQKECWSQDWEILKTEQQHVWTKRCRQGEFPLMIHQFALVPCFLGRGTDERCCVLAKKKYPSSRFRLHRKTTGLKTSQSSAHPFVKQRGTLK